MKYLAGVLRNHLLYIGSDGTKPATEVVMLLTSKRYVVGEDGKVTKTLAGELEKVTFHAGPEGLRLVASDLNAIADEMDSILDNLEERTGSDLKDIGDGLSHDGAAAPVATPESAPLFDQQSP